MSEPEAKPEADTVDVPVDQESYDQGYAAGKEDAEEDADFSRDMRARAMRCRELTAMTQARAVLGEYASGEHVDAIDAAIVRVCDAMGDA